MRFQRPGSRLDTIVVCIAALISVREAAGQLPNPRLSGLRPSGGCVGTTVDVVVRGDDLDEPETIVFSHPGITGALSGTAVAGWRRSRDTPFTVTIAKDVPLGVYEARVLGRFGLSTSWPFIVGDVPVVQETSGNDTPGKAMVIEPDTVVEGELLGGRVDYYRFRAASGRRFVLVCESRALHGRFDLVVQVSGPGGAVLGSAMATRSRDPVLPFTTREEGEHLIRVTDSSFRAGDPKEGPADRYRISVSSRPHLVRLWPPVAQAGQSGTHQAVGFLLPGGRPLGGRGLEEADVVVPALQATNRRSGPSWPLNGLAAFGVDAGTFQLSTAAGPSNPLAVAIAPAAPRIEVEPNDPQAPQRLELPADLVGRFDGPGDVDWYQFDAAKGDRIAVEVLSERLGVAADVAAVIEQVSRDAKGKEQVRTVVEHDEPPRRFPHPPCDFESSDPRFVFTVDGEGPYRLGLRNIAGGSYADTAAVYRLLVRPAGPDFRLLAAVGDLGASPGDAADNTLNVPAIPRLHRGGRAAVVVHLDRVDGFDGPVSLTIDGLPHGVTAPPVTIAAGVNSGLVVLEAAPDAAAWRGPIRIVGTGRVADAERRHEATWAAVTWTKKQNQQTSARLLDVMPLEVTETPAAVRVSVTADGLGPVRAGDKVTIPFTVEATAELKAAVRVEVRELPAAKVGPPYPKTPSKSLDAGQTSGSIEVTIPADTPPGEHAIHLVAQASLLLVRNPAAVAAATAALAEFESRRAMLQEAVDASTKQAEQAAAAAKAAEATGDDAPDQLAAAKEAAKAADAAAATARSALAAHVKEEKPLGQQVAAVQKANEPKPTVVFATSGPIRLTVTKP